MTLPGQTDECRLELLRRGFKMSVNYHHPDVVSDV
jgi:hypothetical protein